MTHCLHGGGGGVTAAWYEVATRYNGLAHKSYSVLIYGVYVYSLLVWSFGYTTLSSQK